MKVVVSSRSRIAHCIREGGKASQGIVNLAHGTVIKRLVLVDEVAAHSEEILAHPELRAESVYRPAMCLEAEQGRCPYV